MTKQVSDFNSFGCHIPCFNDKNTEKKITIYNKICGAIHRSFKN
jgi:hypothetical protein